MSLSLPHHLIEKRLPINEISVDTVCEGGSLVDHGPVVGDRVDFAAVYPDSLKPVQCLAYHRDRNGPWADCRPRQLAGGLEQFRQDADQMSRWLYAHTPDGWAACRAEPDSRWGSIPDAVLADAAARLDSTRQDIQAGRRDPPALERLGDYIAAGTDRPWQPPALRQLLDDKRRQG